ncbi:uncharacterized protein F54H12.2 [Trichonephila clavipes]|uniref:Uncharacterized protein F54H12.2 n=1 Tax=Trichonephila clavipes TaxID=2585209 RepID=A0A8X6VRJ9_TRICX|nr:uncharacterized protein F54H12.2 [Trichonephila clavipes]
MAFILKYSPECVKSELELFNLPGTQTVIQDGQWKQISGSAEDYIDLSQTQLYVKAKIVKVDNTPITKDDTIGPVNLFLHSLFSQVDVSLNDCVVSNSNNTYPYRSYIETLLNHGYDSKTSQLTAELFYKDSDDSLKKRTEFFKESATVDMIGCIHSDLFHQDRLLLNLVDLKIKLIRSKPEFCLQGSEGFKVVLDHVSLFIRKVRVNPGVILGHAKALEKTSAKYSINRVLCKVYSIPKGSMSFIQDNIFSGQMPKKLFVGCVDNEAFHGAFSKSPYEFKHFNLNFIGVYVDGQPVPHNPLELDFSKDQYIRAYQTLFVRTDRMGQDRGIFISRKEYKDSITLFGFNLSPDLCSSGEHLSLIKHSNLRLELKFSKSLEQTVCVIVFAEFANLIEINKSRNILYDFGNERMDGMQMYTVLSQEKTTSPYFQGVYSRDTLPPLQENMCAIVNSDDSSQPGTHWLALFVNDKRELEFYDSFGQPPVFYNTSTTTYLDVLWNSKVFQSPTSNV